MTAVRRPPAQPRPFGRALMCSAAVHVCAIAALASVVMRSGVAPPDVHVATAKPADVQVPVARIVFLPSRVPGGGGGGGNRQPGPIRRAEGIGTDSMTLRIARPAPIDMAKSAVEAAPALPAVVLDALPLASGTRDLVGLPSGGVSGGISTGMGTGGGVGTGTGTGIGSGTGPGVGEGSGGGTGGGVYRAGGAVTAPRLVSQIRPTYTADALARRIQGSVVLEMIVTSEGSPAHLRIVRSLDPELDQLALDAVAQWKFEPGKLSGRPVSVLVTVVLDFTIH